MHARISPGETSFIGASLAELDTTWRQLAPKRVSFLSHTVLGHEPAALRALLAEGGYQVETITHVLMPGQQLSLDETSWQAPRERLSQLIGVARELGARSIYFLSGGRGTLDWEDAARAFSAVIAPCVTEAKAAGLQLLIEPASPLHADLNIAHSLRDTIALAEMAGIGVCLDVFACWTEAGLRASIERAVPRCGIVQLSDYVYGDRAYPCRAVPGDGVIPLRRVLEWLLGAGYGGAFDLELLGPRIEQEGRAAAVARAADHIGQLLHELGA